MRASSQRTRSWRDCVDPRWCSWEIDSSGGQAAVGGEGGPGREMDRVGGGDDGGVEPGVEPEDLRRTRWTAPRKTLPMFAMLGGVYPKEAGWSWLLAHASGRLAVVKTRDDSDVHSLAVCNLHSIHRFPFFPLPPSCFLSLAVTKYACLSHLSSRQVSLTLIFTSATSLGSLLFPQPQLYRCVPLPGLRVVQDPLPAACLRRRSRAMANVLVCARLCHRR